MTAVPSGFSPTTSTPWPAFSATPSVATADKAYLVGASTGLSLASSTQPISTAVLQLLQAASSSGSVTSAPVTTTSKDGSQVRTWPVTCTCSSDCRRQSHGC